MKGSIDTRSLSPTVAAYLGRSDAFDVFDVAIARWAVGCADRSERNHARRWLGLVSRGG